MGSCHVCKKKALVANLNIEDEDIQDKLRSDQEPFYFHSDQKNKLNEDVVINNQIIPFPTDFLRIYDKTSISPLGSGAFGSVFSIKKLKDGGDFAVKRQVFQDVDDFQNIAKEINILYRLIPFGNIVSFNENYSDLKNRAILMVMEMGDYSLADLVKKNPTGLQSDLLKMLLIDMTFGLSFAYKYSVVHSDIKPANILVFEKISRKDTLNVFQDPKFEKMLFKLTDFGAGTIKVSNEETKIRKGMGYTLAYAAPEVNMSGEDGEKVSINFEKADVYSLGMTLMICCGISLKKIVHINKMQFEENHDKEMEGIFQCLATEYAWIVPILRGMLKFNKDVRLYLKQILEELKIELPDIQMPTKQRIGKQISEEEQTFEKHLPPVEIAEPTEFDFKSIKEKINTALENFREGVPFTFHLKIPITGKKNYHKSPNKKEVNQTFSMKYRSGEMYNGCYMDGFRSIAGVQTWPNEQCYDGKFRRDFPSGKGKMIFNDGSLFEGHWWEGLMANGTLYQNNKTIYMGSFESDLKNGFGIELDQNGLIYEGPFIKGKKHGEGIIMELDKKLYVVKFEEGKIVSKGENVKDFQKYELINKK